MLSKRSPLFIGNPTIDLETIDSTNIYANELISSGNPSEGTAVFSAFQTHGQGQFGKKWQAKAGENLTGSIILKPSFLSPDQQFCLTIVVALSISQLLEEIIDKPIWIKWPNDIYINRKKIAGVLIQNAIYGKRLENSIVGIGLNVNQNHFPSALPNPTSLALESGKKHDIISLRTHLFSNLERNYLQLKSKGKDELQVEYLSRLFQRNERRPYLIKQNTLVDGIIKGVNNQGLLMVEIEEHIQHFQMSEIQYRL